MSHGSLVTAVAYDAPMARALERYRLRGGLRGIDQSYP
jgi:hypothetical protein